MEYFKVQSVLDIEIRVTKKHWEKIINIKHPVMEGKEESVKKALGSPVQVRRSKIDPNVHLYYASYRRRYLCVVARHEDNRGFIITAYITDKIKEGEVVWKR